VKLGKEVGLGQSHIVLDGDHGTQFSADVHCGQTTGCIKMPLSTEVGLDPRAFVLHVEPAPPKKGHSPSLNFTPTSIVVKG